MDNMGNPLVSNMSSNRFVFTNKIDLSLFNLFPMYLQIKWLFNLFILFIGDGNLIIKKNIEINFMLIFLIFKLLNFSKFRFVVVELKNLSQNSPSSKKK